MALSTTSRPKLRGADGSISEAGDQAAGSRNAPVLGHHRRGLVEQRALVLAVEGPGVRDIVEHILRVHAESARDAASERELNAASRRQGAPLGRNRSVGHGGGHFDQAGEVSCKHPWATAITPALVMLLQ